MAELNIVTIINKTDKDFVDYQDGQKYTVPAKGALPVPDYCAKLWLGDLSLEDEIAKVNETDRVAMRTGVIPEGLYVKEWKQKEEEKAVVSAAEEGRICLGTKANGKPCKALAVKGRNYCRSHTSKEALSEAEAVSKGAITPS